MNISSRSPQSEAFATLRRFVRAPQPVERCGLCGLALAPEHRHLLELEKRAITCACDPCALRFTDVVGGRFKIIPRDTRALPGFQIDDSAWESLALPINLVFFFQDSRKDHVTALYPSPAGAMESLLHLETWQALRERNPLLLRMEPDVEALLVNRVGAAREYFLAPIDVCFSLVGLIRLHWRGLSGGNEAWREIGDFFARLKATAKAVEVAHA